jgi:uncharacterized protein YcbX
MTRTLLRVNTTPVKGMALHHPDRVSLEPSGVPGDRRFYLVDDSGALCNGGRYGMLHQVHPAYDPETDRLSLRFPDRATVEGDAAAQGAAAVTDFYGRAVAAHAVEGPFSAAISGFVGRPVRLMRSDRPGDAVDVMPLTIVSLASVRDLGEQGRHEGPLDARRFRINLELEGCEPYDEDSWEGTTISIGDALLRVRGQIPRCVVTTLDPDTGRKDWDTLTQIAKYRRRIPGAGGLPFGMYATVERPAEVRVGDPVLPAAEAD